MKVDVRKIFQELVALMRERFHGKVVLSYNNGRITNIRKEHSISMEKFKADENV